MALTVSKVGIAPGTTTLSLGRHARYTQQDPGVTVHNAYGQVMGDSYFDARPTDFEMVPRRGYLPVHRGWVTGKLSGAELGQCGRGCGCGPCATGLGEEVATESSGAALDPNERAEVARILSQLEIEHKTHAIREAKSRRFWGSIIGLASGTGAIIAVLNYLAVRKR